MRATKLVARLFVCSLYDYALEKIKMAVNTKGFDLGGESSSMSVPQFLESLNLKSYKLNFLNEGYDDLNQLIFMDSSTITSTFDCTFGGEKIPMVTSYPYLGTILTPSGSFNVNNEHLYKQRFESNL